MPVQSTVQKLVFDTLEFKCVLNVPRTLVDPSDEFRIQDMEDYLRDKCLEIKAGKRYQCDFCKKSFISEDFVLKHIRNKHVDLPRQHDKVDEVGHCFSRINMSY